MPITKIKLISLKKRIIIPNNFPQNSIDSAFCLRIFLFSFGSDFSNCFSVYVDASDKCNELAFNFQEGTSTVTRTWSIRVTQYDCSYSNLAPQGCTQYFYGATSGLVRTYNFDGGIHLADQDQNICVR